MGITIHYRGTIDDLTLVDQFENRVLDMAFAVGGRATIWRSYADHDPERMVRGLLLDIAPGQETVSLLLSHEGQLINSFEIEAAEKGPLPQPSTCFVKTQFGGVEAHVALVHLLSALKENYFRDLNVEDESGYFENRDVKALQQKIEETNKMLEKIAEGVNRYGLSPEAAEDPDIVAARIERIVKLVQDKFLGDENDVSRPIGTTPDSQTAGPLTLEDEVAFFESLARDGLKKKEFLHRSIKEGLAEGKTIEDVLNEVIHAANPNSKQVGDAELQSVEQEFPWSVSEVNEDFLETTKFDHAFDEAFEDLAEPEASPSRKLAEKMLLRLMKISTAMSETNKDSEELGWIEMATKHLCEINGALSFAGGMMPSESFSSESDGDVQTRNAITIVQLKRALKAHSFARGALFALHGKETIDKETIEGFHASLEAILEDIHQQIAAAWGL